MPAPHREASHAPRRLPAIPASVDSASAPALALNPVSGNGSKAARSLHPASGRDEGV